MMDDDDLEFHNRSIKRNQLSKITPALTIKNDSELGLGYLNSEIHKPGYPTATDLPYSETCLDSGYIL